MSRRLQVQHRDISSTPGPQRSVCPSTSRAVGVRQRHSSTDQVHPCCRDGMTRPEAEELVKTAVALAMTTDSSSGGVIRLVTVDKSGPTRQLVKPEDMPPFWDELAHVQGGAVGMVMA